jgi:DNA-binding NarL/FixJ family response regulator
VSVRVQHILLVEDEPAWQQAITQLLKLVPELNLLGFTDNEAEALALFRQQKPHWVLLDWQLKTSAQDGLRLAEAFIEHGMPQNRIVLISAANPQEIPSHPFLSLPKSQLAQKLLPLLQSGHLA